MHDKYFMHKIFAFLLFLSLPLWAQIISIDEIKPVSGYTAKFSLEDSTSNDFVILDCQSFFQKADFHDRNGKLTSENFITIGECEYLFNITNTCLANGQVKCFDADYLFNDECPCQ